MLALGQKRNEKYNRRSKISPTHAGQRRFARNLVAYAPAGGDIIDVSEPLKKSPTLRRLGD